MKDRILVAEPLTTACDWAKGYEYRAYIGGVNSRWIFGKNDGFADCGDEFAGYIAEQLKRGERAVILHFKGETPKFHIETETRGSRWRGVAYDGVYAIYATKWRV